ncbi:hypothetical protein [Alicyclobacillus sp.]|uniref:hypothetical protein n=1 Tax=Alicyclobacillus sp. TaxID=61169 RepID=UPI0025C1AC7E|nr:hypothetical protein [Alicyclobacillus sp.]MCL6517042.1 hypothetical protein [Alicyclobacillus sp.]
MDTRSLLTRIALKQHELRFRTPEGDFWLHESEEEGGWVFEVANAGVICIALDLEEAMDCVESMADLEEILQACSH